MRAAAWVHRDPGLKIYFYFFDMCVASCTPLAEWRFWTLCSLICEILHRSACMHIQTEGAKALHLQARTSLTLLKGTHGCGCMRSPAARTAKDAGLLSLHQAGNSGAGLRRWWWMLSTDRRTHTLRAQQRAPRQ